MGLTVEGDSFRAEKPRLWAERRFTQLINAIAPRNLALHPDGNRFAVWIYDWMHDGLTRLTEDPANDETARIDAIGRGRPLRSVAAP